MRTKVKVEKAPMGNSGVLQQLASFPQQQVPILELKLAEYNPREITREQMRALKRSVREYGFVQPVVARSEDRLVIGGHQRIAAMTEILREDKIDPKLFTLPVVFLSGLSDEKAKLLNLGLNKISGSWDYDALASLMSSLSTLAPDVLALSGFSMDEVQEVLDLLPQGIELPNDEVPIDPDEALAAEALRFVFQLTTKADAEVLKRVLKEWGMTSLKTNGAMALMKIVRACDEEIEPEKE